MDEGGDRCELDSEMRKFVDIHILLVDDDATSLAVVSAMLRVCKYQVVTLKNPIEALDTLRARKGFFDLVVTDLHMPQMNGLQLQKQVAQEFKLPVIMMSANEKPSVILKSLEEGVAFYMVKPISLDDVKHVWQYAITAKKVTPDQTRTIMRRELSIDIEESPFKESSSWREVIKSKSQKTKNKKAKENRVAKTAIAIRKPKVIWTNSLHNRFLQAIRLIGLDKAVPKKILEFMNVPSLTRENIASHLQKYRIFLKRVAEKGARSMKIYSDYTLLKSNFAPAHFQSPLYISKFQSQHPNFPENQRLMAPLNYQSPTFRANLSHLTLPKPSFEAASMENPSTHLGNQKYSSLLTNNKPNFSNFNGLVSSSTREDQNFVLMENEKPKYSSNRRERMTQDDRMICSGGNGVCNVQASHDLKINNGGLSLDGGTCVSGGSFFGNFEGTNQLLQVVSNTNVEKNGSGVLVSSEEEVNVNNIWKAANETIAFGDIGEDQNCFDVLSEIFMGHNNSQTSLRKEEMVDMELSDIWNGIEIDASAKEDLHPSSLFAHGWDDDILEIFLFGDGSS